MFKLCFPQTSSSGSTVVPLVGGLDAVVTETNLSDASLGARLVSEKFVFGVYATHSRYAPGDSLRRQEGLHGNPVYRFYASATWCGPTRGMPAGGMAQEFRAAQQPEGDMRASERPLQNHSILRRQ